MIFEFLKNTWLQYKQRPVQSLLVFCLYSFLFLLPWQTIYIFQKTQNGTVGIFGFEILLWVLFILFTFTKPPKQKQISKKYSLFQKILFLFFLYCFVSVFFASQKLLAFFQIIRIGEAFILYYMLTHIHYKKTVALMCFLAGSAVQSVLGIFQFLTQSTVSFKWLGLVAHPVFETGSSVVQSLEAGRVLRAYGAFPHPNVFGGYLVVSIFLTTIIFIKYFQNSQNEKIFSKQFFKSFFSKKTSFILLLLALHITALFFTFSRSAWLAAALWFTTLFFFFFKQKNKKIFFLFFLLIFQVIFLCTTHISLLKTRIQASSVHEIRSIEERKNLSLRALQIFKTQPLFGVGVGNYVSAVRTQNSSVQIIEPVHMVPLLILVEFGVVGVLFIMLLAFVFLKQQKIKREDYFFLIVISPLFVFDHYLYSLPFGVLLVATFFGLLQTKSFSTPQFFCPCSGEFDSIDTLGKK